MNYIKRLFKPKPKGRPPLMVNKVNKFEAVNKYFRGKNITDLYGNTFRIMRVEFDAWITEREHGYSVHTESIMLVKFHIKYTGESDPFYVHMGPPSYNIFANRYERLLANYFNVTNKTHNCDGIIIEFKRLDL